MDYDAAIKMIAQFEGDIPYMYLDTKGNVTVGVGHNIGRPATCVTAATSLGFVRKDTGASATREEVAADLAALRGLPYGQKFPAEYYAPHIKLELPAAVRRRLLRADLGTYVADLHDRFPRFDTFPECAQLALLDMDFNLGPKFDEFVNLSAAANATPPRWEACAKECHRKGPNEARNAATKELFHRAALLGLRPLTHVF